MAQILVPIFVCVVLPVAIIAIIFGASINSDNKRSKVLIKAIESNCDIDADKLAEALQKPKKTALEILNLRLLRGCIFSLVGIAVCIIGIIAYSMGMEFQTDAVTVPLIFGGISLAIGLSYLVVYFVTRKQINE
jgi:TRAP-type C4-dicarboxylate transport system permease small subunit